MKKTVTLPVILLISVLAASAFMIKSSNGIAGYTGSPGEATCSSCHGGGSSATSGVTITAVPEFSLNQYMPDSTYQITVTGAASGFNFYGFGCEILNENLADAGTMQNAGPGVKFINGTKRNATHTTPKSGTQGVFTFEWVAPASGSVAIYAMVNAVNKDNNTGGDFPLAPFAMSLTAMPAAPQPTNTVGLEQIKEMMSGVVVFPNPAHEFTHIRYQLKQAGMVKVEILDLNGRPVKTLLNDNRSTGLQHEILNLQGIAAGVYFVKTSHNDVRVSQKLITVK